MATTIAESFRQFATNLNITDRQTTIVANCKNNMVDKLGAKLSLHEEKARVIGSWDRDTLTRYLGEADVDVMVILHYGDNHGWFNAQGTHNALASFKSILGAAYPDTPSRIDENCVTMKLAQFRLDVVPAFRWEDGTYRIPDTREARWIPTSPIKFAEGITAVNKQMSGTFVPLIKMIKGWNRHAGWPIKSYHLECMMYRHYMGYTESYTYNSTVRVFLERLPGYLGEASFDFITGERVDTYLNVGSPVTGRAKAIAKAQSAAAAAVDAYESESKYPSNPSVPITKWKALLGEFFPAYG